MFDNGYDVSDYYKIDKKFGTMKDFDILMKKAKELDIKIIIDVILNHVS
jgi:glycosidase